MDAVCFECGDTIESETLEALAEAFLDHGRANHEWPWPDQAIKNYAEATQRLTGGSERLDSIGEIEVHRVTEKRIDDWRYFFDHDAFVGSPEWAGCYCLEPHVRVPGEPPADDAPFWKENRDAMAKRLAEGLALGYLAYVDNKAVGWVNASLRRDYTLYRDVDPDGPDPEAVIGISCFIVAPPYRQHGVAEALLNHVIEDSGSRGVDWIEAYPFNEPGEGHKNFRGPRSMFENRGFEEVEVRDREAVLRRPAT